MRTGLLLFPLILAAGCGSQTSNVSEAPASLAAFTALGDSVMAGYGVQKGAGEVALFHDYLQNTYGHTIALKDLSTPGATSQSILNNQVSQATTFIGQYAKSGVTVAVNAGGNDLLAFVYSGTYSSTCLKGDLVNCYASVSKILSSAEKNLDTILGRLRTAAGPANRILVLTYANSKASPGCAAANEVALFEGALEGVPNSTIPNGLNDRIRDLANRYDAEVVELGKVLLPANGGTIARDCIHPTASGYKLIYNEMARLFGS